MFIIFSCLLLFLAGFMPTTTVVSNFNIILKLSNDTFGLAFRMVPITLRKGYLKLMSFCGGLKLYRKTLGFHAGCLPAASAVYLGPR